jgi:8-oxo-dGTP diphosphatase
MNCCDQWAVAPKAWIQGPSGRFLFLQRSAKSRHFASQWEVPGGKPDAGEDIAACLIRETKEETGLDLTITGVAGAAGGEIPGLNLAYLFLHGTVDSESVHISDEHDDCRWLALEEAESLNLLPALKDFINSIATS